MKGSKPTISAARFPTRRAALVGGAATGVILLSSAARAQRSAGLIRSYAPPRQLKDVDHAVVYRREDEFCAWPHVNVFADLGNGELVQNFNSVPSDYSTPDAIGHDKLNRSGQAKLGAKSRRKIVCVRSKDQGRTWDGDHPVINPFDRRAAGTAKATTLADLRPIDPRDRNVLFSTDSSKFGTGEARSVVRVSRDGGRSWSPDFPLPLDGLRSLSGMNSMLIRPDGTVLLWLFESGPEGFDRHPLIYALPPGGREFHFMSFVTPKTDPYGNVDGEYPGWLFGGNHWYYPRGYLMPSGMMLCVLRSQRDPRGIMWLEVFASEDGGDTWAFRSRVNDFGAPGSLVVLPDGRLVMVYGYRLMPSGIRAKVSDDEGRTWGPELIVRDDGGSWDLGYPNAWVTDDGKVGVIYYFNSNHDRINVNGGVRHIARSIFSVD